MAFKSSIGNFDKIRESIVNSTKKEEKNTPSIFFSPKVLPGGKEATYTIRFLPIETTTGQPWNFVRMHMFKRAGDNRYIKCVDPRSFDKKAVNPIADKGWELKKSDNALDQKQSAKFRSKGRYLTLVYIKEAPEHHKEVEGKVLIFEAGEKVGQKMEAAIGKLKLCFWDAYKGTDFLLSVIEKGEGNEKYPNYDASEFLRDSGPIVDDDGKMEEIAKIAEKIDIMKVFLERYPVLPGKQLQELMDGGIKTTSDTSSEETEISTTTSQSVTKPVTTEPDFGEVEKPKTKPVEKKVEPTTTLKANVQEEVQANADDINLDFNTNDFNFDT